MSKKHFAAIAAVVALTPVEGRLSLAHMLAWYFAEIDPRFDHESFLHACGV